MEAPTVSENNSDGVRVGVAQERREEKEEQRTEDPVSTATTYATTSDLAPNSVMEDLARQEDESTMRQQEADGSSAPYPKGSTGGSVGNDEKANPTFLLTQAAHISEATSAPAPPAAAVTAAPVAMATSITAPEILHRSPPKVTPISAAIESPASPASSAPTTPSSTIAPSPAKMGVTTAPSAAADVPRKRGVPHIYRDYSAVPDTIGYVRKKTGGVTQPFPEKLHELLERENEPTVISWLPHGRAFLVRKPKEFTQDVMPRYVMQIDSFNSFLAKE